MTLPLENLGAIGQGELDALEARMRDELGLELEAAVILVVIRAPEGDAMDRYSLVLQAGGERLQAIPEDARIALASSCAQTAADLVA